MNFFGATRKQQRAKVNNDAICIVASRAYLLDGAGANAAAINSNLRA